MVVIKDPTVVDFVVVVEATANMLNHWETMKKSYIRPAVEYFNGRQPSALDYIGNNGSSQFGYVLFSAADCVPDLVTRCSNVTRSPWEFLKQLNSISFSGGGCERSSLVSEGLGRTLQLFDDLAQRRRHGHAMQVCFLVCNSPPYDIPCSENYLYNGHTAGKLAELMGNKGIHLSVISPQQIRPLRELFISANHNELPSMNYAQDPRHLVLISGFQLPTERDPVKLTIKDDQKQVKNVSNGNTLNSVTTSMSVPSPAKLQTSSSTVFAHNNQMNSIAPSPDSLFSTSTPQSHSGQQNSAGTMSTNVNLNFTSPAQPMRTPETNSLPNPQTTQQNFPISQNSQPQPSMDAINTNASISQSNNEMPFSKAALGQGSNSNNFTGNDFKSVASTNLKDMLQPSIPTPRSTQAQLLIPDSQPFQQSTNNTANMGSHDLNTNINLNSDLSFNQPSGMQSSTMPDQSQSRLGTTSMPQQRMGDTLPFSSVSSTMPQAPPYSTPNSLNTGIQNNQIINTNISLPNSFASTQTSFLQNRNNRPNFSSHTSSGIMHVNQLGVQQINTGQMPSNQPQQGVMGESNLGQQQSLQRINNPGQDPSVTSPYSVVITRGIADKTTRSAADGMRLAWDGTFEWTEKRKFSQGNQGTARATHLLQCQVYLRQNQSDETLNASQWPAKLNMQLIPQVVLSSMKNQMKNNISVSLRMSPNDQRQQLANIMKNKWMGLIQIQSPSQNTAENKVMLVIYSLKSSQFFGVLPLDPHNFIQTIRAVIARHQPQGSAGGPARQIPGMQQIPQSNVDSGMSVINTFQPQAGGQIPAGQGQFNISNTNQNIRPNMPSMQQSQSIMTRGVMNPVMSQVRTGMPMQSNMNNPQQRNFVPGQRMPNTQMSNQQPILMNQQTAQQQQVTQSNMGQSHMQQHGNQQFMYQNNVNPQRTLVQKQMDQNDVMRQQQQQQQQQQQLQRIRFQQQQQQQQTQVRQIGQIQGPGSHEQLRTLLQSGNNMGQNIQRPRMQTMNAGMRPTPQNVASGFVQNPQVRQPGMQNQRMMTMQPQQQRFNNM